VVTQADSNNAAARATRERNISFFFRR
jgi:hypothetical protein